MSLKELYHPETGRMRVAGLMSGNGTNLVKIIEHEKDLEEKRGGYSPYKVEVIFTENPNSNAECIGGEYDIPVIERDIAEFYREKGKPRKDLDVKREFDKQTVRLLRPRKIDVIAYAGYDGIATPVLVDAFLGVNVHPADLSIMNGKERKYTGNHGVRDAILAGDRKLRSTTHIVRGEVDSGEILMISPPLVLDIPNKLDLSGRTESSRNKIRNLTDFWQNKLKKVGDHRILPETLQHIADGRYSQDEGGRLHFDNEPIPFGVMLSG